MTIPKIEFIAYKLQFIINILNIKINFNLRIKNSFVFKGFTLTLQETRSIYDSMNIPKIEFIAYIYILL